MDQRYWFLITAALAGIALIILVLVTDWHKRRRDSLSRSLSEIRGTEPSMSGYKAELTALRDQLSAQVVQGAMDPALAARCTEVYGQIMTGSPLMDSMLTQKQAACRELGVEFDCRVTQVPARIEDRDLVGLFGNLLDNAIEAAARSALGAEGKGWVRAVSGQKAMQWTFTVENAKAPGEMPLANGMQSTKTSPGEHGLGSRIIDRTAKKYQGFVRRSDLGDEFRVLVSMPMEAGS